MNTSLISSLHQKLVFAFVTTLFMVNPLFSQEEIPEGNSKRKVLLFAQAAIGAPVNPTYPANGVYKDDPLAFWNLGFLKTYPLRPKGWEFSYGLAIDMYREGFIHEFDGQWPPHTPEPLVHKRSILRNGVAIPLFVGWESTHPSWKYFLQGGFSLLYAFNLVEWDKLEGPTTFKQYERSSFMDSPVGGLMPQFSAGTRSYHNNWFWQISATASWRYHTNFADITDQSSVYAGIQLGIGWIE